MDTRETGKIQNQGDKRTEEKRETGITVATIKQKAEEAWVKWKH